MPDLADPKDLFGGTLGGARCGLRLAGRRSATHGPIDEAIALIGAPTDIGAGARGASMGPEALRVAQLQPMLEAQGARGRSIAAT